MKGSRILRHDRLCRLLSGQARRCGWKVHWEPRFRADGGGLKKPDLLLVKNECALIVDVTVPFEKDPATLSLAAAAKRDKYEELAPAVREGLRAVSNVAVLGFPVGARGLWHPDNSLLLRDLGLRRRQCDSFAKLLSREALLGSLRVLRTFRTGADRS